MPLELVSYPGFRRRRIFDINARGDIVGASDMGVFAWMGTADGAGHVLPKPGTGQPDLFRPHQRLEAGRGSG